MFYTILTVCLILLWEFYIFYLYYRRLQPTIADLNTQIAHFVDPPAGPEEVHDCALHRSITPVPDRIGEPDYFTLHSHRARDLEDLQLGTYGDGDEGQWSDRQLQARQEFVDLYRAAPDGAPLNQPQLEFLLLRLDTIFFSGALTQSAAQRLAADQAPGPFVRLQVIDHDPYSLWRIRGRHRCAFVGVTDIAASEAWVDPNIHQDNNDNNNDNNNNDNDNNGNGNGNGNDNGNNALLLTEAGEVARNAGYRTSRPLTITLARRYYGFTLTKAEQLEALYHECVHSFIHLYWERCPNETVDIFGGNEHGEVFHVMLSHMLQTTVGWHVELRPMVDNIRDFNIYTANQPLHRLLVLAVYVVLEYAGLWAVQMPRDAGRACVRFWRDHGSAGVFAAVLGLFVIRVILWAFWDSYVDPGVFVTLQTRM